MSDELDVCPFCGAHPLLNEIAPHSHNLTIGGVKLPDHPGSWTIECPACECGMIADTKESVTAAWNRRAQPAEEVQQDAKRYRYMMRDGETAIFVALSHLCANDDPLKPQMDAAIDEAMTKDTP